MGKAPAFQFYANDFMQDVNVLTLGATGAWIKCLCKMWYAPTKGVITLPLLGYARLWGCTADQAEAVLDELMALEVCDYIDGRTGESATSPDLCNADVMECNANVTDGITLISRRMLREHIDREANKNRVKRHREKKKKPKDEGSVPPSNEDVTPPSSTSSSTSCNLELHIPPNPQGGDVTRGSEIGMEIFPPHATRKNKTEQKRIKVKANTPQMVRIGGWFGRQSDTLWTVYEALALRQLNPPVSEVGLMEQRYKSGDKYLRHNIETLINQWSGELDKARKQVNQTEKEKYEDGKF